MFKSIKFLRYDKESRRHVYWLEDTDFSCEVVAVEPDNTTCAAVVAAKAASAALEYRKRNLPIAKSLALFYMMHQKQGYSIPSLLEYDKIYIDKYYPEANYGKEIFPEVQKKLEMLLLLA